MSERKANDKAMAELDKLVAGFLPKVEPLIEKILDNIRDAHKVTESPWMLTTAHTDIIFKTQFEPTRRRILALSASIERLLRRDPLISHYGNRIGHRGIWKMQRELDIIDSQSKMKAAEQNDELDQIRETFLHAKSQLNWAEGKTMIDQQYQQIAEESMNSKSKKPRKLRDLELKLERWERRHFVQALRQA